MWSKQLFLISSFLSCIQVQAQESTPETVLGIYVFHRHGDRTAKAYTPTVLTDLGYAQVYSSGQYYRQRYIDSNATSPIYGISSDVVKYSQLNVQAPFDTVLSPSASGFLQGLYPPVGATLGSQKLANGSSVQTPLNGYQLIPVEAVTSATSTSSSEDSAWLQGQSGCANAITSSNDYFFSDEYLEKLNSTKGFYQSLLPVINTTFNASVDTFKNAYSIYDYVHVSTIHNSSIPSDDLLTNETLFQLQTLADNHEFNLAYNASSPIRAIAGSTLAAQILQQLNATITGKSKTPVNIQFGAYASFLSFFGLSGLSSLSPDFTGVNGYASSMSFELLTSNPPTNTTYPSPSEISVRFLWSNGSASEFTPVAYPLFNLSNTTIPWATFVDKMNGFAVGDQESWCGVCGTTGDVCAAYTSNSTSSSGEGDSASGSSGGISKAVAGVIGAMVTLAVVLGLEALVLLLAGLRVVRKGRGGPATGGQVAGGNGGGEVGKVG